MVKRTLILAFLAMIAGAGCAAGTSGGQVRQPPAVAKETALTKTRIIAQINKNAEAIRSLQADSTIEASEGGHSPHTLRGRMRMEREKDFRLELSIMSKAQADIGSNEKGFWFWVNSRDRSENKIYVCNYDSLSTSRLSLTMQPDWIMEAMGLRVISAREAATINAKPGDLPGQLLLTQLRKEPNGVTYTKETVVNETTGEIIEHRLYAGAKTELLARATIKSHIVKAIESADGPGKEVRVSLPDHFTLDWIAEKFKLEITMPDPRVNPEFSKKMVADLFSEPTIPGATRVDLAAVTQGPANASSFIHETMPRGGIKLGKPQAVPGDDGATARSSRPATSSDLTGLPELPSETAVIGPQIPQGSSTDPAVQPTSRRAWRPVYEN